MCGAGPADLGRPGGGGGPVSANSSRAHSEMALELVSGADFV